MKRKLMITSVVAMALFAGLILVVGLMKSSQHAGLNNYQVSATSDGRLIVQPPDRPTSVVMSKASVTNVPVTPR
jgi:hypothetical protein